jgi:xylulokinase/glycerol kinase
MAEDIILVIDVGTTSARSLLFDREFRMVASAAREYRNSYPGPFLVEQDPDVWWRAAIEVSKEAMEAKPSGSGVAAVIVTSQRATVIPVDRNGSPLRPAILWQDNRSMPQCRRIRDAVGDAEIYKRTGLKINPYFSLPKILWIKENEPDTFEAAHKFLLVHDFILHRFTKRFVTDQSHASRTMAYNLRRHWDEDILGAVGVDPAKFCRAVPSGERVGAVSAGASRLTSIPEGTPVFAGAGDQQAAAVGMGIVAAGTFMANTGTGSFVLSPLDEPVLDPRERVLCTISAVPDKWLQEAGMYTTGSVYRWFRDQMSTKEEETARERGLDPYDLLNEQASTAPVGSSGVMWIPHFTGSLAPYWNPISKGVLFNLSLGTTRAEVIRALLEGIAIEVGKNISIMEEIGGKAREIRVAGGATKSPLFNQIQADVYGTRVVTTNFAEATGLGAALLAAPSLGWHPSLEKAVEKVVQVVSRYEPYPDAHARYRELAKLHHELYRTLQEGGIFESAASLSEKFGAGGR